MARSMAAAVFPLGQDVSCSGNGAAFYMGALDSGRCELYHYCSFYLGDTFFEDYCDVEVTIDFYFNISGSQYGKVKVKAPLVALSPGPYIQICLVMQQYRCDCHAWVTMWEQGLSLQDLLYVKFAPLFPGGVVSIIHVEIK